MNIEKKLPLIFSIMIAATAVIILLSTVVITKVKWATDVDKTRVEEIDKVRKYLKNQADIVHTMLQSQYDEKSSTEYISTKYGTRLKNIIDVTENQLKNQGAGLSKNQAKRIVKNIRYDKGTGYIWINDMGTPYPKMIMHPTAPALDGKILDNQKYFCALGKNENLFKATVDVASDRGEGFVDYMWAKPTAGGLTEDQPKVSYVRKFSKFNWVLGTGIYVDEANEDMKKELLEAVKSIRYDNGEGYFFITDLGTPYPTMLMHPIQPDLEGAVMKDTKYNENINGKNSHLYKAIAEIANSKREGYLDYSESKIMPDGSSKKLPKISYIKVFEPLGWVVETGQYIDRIDAIVQKEADSISSRINGLLLWITGIAILVLIIATQIAVRISKGMTTPLRDISLAAESVALGNVNQEIEYSSDNEIGQLADSFRNITEVQKNIAYAAKSIAQGDYGVAIKVQSEEDLLAKAMIDMRDTLKTNSEEQEKRQLLDKKRATYQNTEVNRLSDNLSRISKGDLKIDSAVASGDKEVEDIKRNFTEMNSELEQVRIAMTGLTDEIGNLTNATLNGELQTRADTSKHQGAYKNILVQVNELNDAFIAPIKKAIENISLIASGKIPPLITEEYKGDFNQIKESVNSCISTINGLIAETGTLTETATNGQLEARGDVDKFENSWSRIIKGINDMLDAIIGPITESMEVIKAMAEKNMTNRVTGDYKGDLDEFKRNINNAADNLDDALTQVNSAVDQISGASGEIASGSQALAEGTSEQAASLEEVAASLEEMNSLTRSNAENARQGSTLSKESLANVNMGNEATGRMSTAMEGISKSTEET
ncbi:MAG: cache domain-containing protein, partial [Candidatus Cloacimonetes bacterium]|nr:cache domain-containing protein [Candidatus Cloacimonadota bacterium]